MAATTVSSRDNSRKDKQKTRDHKKLQGQSYKVTKSVKAHKPVPKTAIVPEPPLQGDEHADKQAETASVQTSKRNQPDDSSLLDEHASKRVRIVDDSVDTLETQPPAPSTNIHSSLQATPASTIFGAQPTTQPPHITTIDTVPRNTPDSFRDLIDLYDTQIMNISTNTTMENKCTRILSHLSRFSFAILDQKLPLVVLVAKAPAANKLTGIVEIVKREIAKGGQKWYQYNVLTSVMEEKKVKAKKGQGSVEKEADAEDEEGDFEMVKTPLEREIEGRPKIRAVPVISIGLSRVRIDGLKAQYGEQTNAPA